MTSLNQKSEQIIKREQRTPSFVRGNTTPLRVAPRMDGKVRNVGIKPKKK